MNLEQILESLKIKIVKLEDLGNAYRIKVEDLNIPKEKLIILSRQFQSTKEAEFYPFTPGEKFGTLIVYKPNKFKPNGIEIGTTEDGSKITLDFYSQTIHTLVGGTTGSGKSNFLNILIEQFLNSNFQVFLLDIKKLDFNHWINTPNFNYTNSPEEFNSWIEKAKAEKSNKLKFFVVDEFAEAKIQFQKKFIQSIQSALQIGRAFGIRFILATQRPSSDIIPGTLKANLDTRICFRVASALESRIILDQTGGETILERGGFLAKIPEVGLTFGKCPKFNPPPTRIQTQRVTKVEPKPKLDPLDAEKLETLKFYKNLLDPYFDYIFKFRRDLLPSKFPKATLFAATPTFDLIFDYKLQNLLNLFQSKIQLKPFNPNLHSFLQNSKTWKSICIATKLASEFGSFKLFERDVLLNGKTVEVENLLPNSWIELDKILNNKSPILVVKFENPILKTLKKFILFGRTKVIYQFRKKPFHSINTLENLISSMPKGVQLEKVEYTFWENYKSEPGISPYTRGDWIANFKDPTLNLPNKLEIFKSQLDEKIPESLFQILNYKYNFEFYNIPIPKVELRPKYDYRDLNEIKNKIREASTKKYHSFEEFQREISEFISQQVDTYLKELNKMKLKEFIEKAKETT